MKSAQVWIRLAAGIVLSIVTALLSSGIIPQDSAWIAILGVLGTIAGYITGEVFVASKYSAGRSAIKVEQLALARAEALANGAKNANPPPVPPEHASTR